MRELPADASLKARLVTLRDTLAARLIERETAVRLALLAALAGEHLLLIGPPGTAKTEMARRLSLAVRDAPLFERLLTRFTVPEELYGPLAIRTLEDNRYYRQTTGYLPSAAFAFLDEIFKANSGILNSLLTLLNEREFDNGTERARTPLISVIGATIEVPKDEELQALYDRFLLRLRIEPITPSNFDALLDLRGTQPVPPEASLRLTRAELEAFRQSARTVDLPEDIKALLKALRTFLDHKKITVSDRRWSKIVYLLQVSAWSHGRGEVSIWDAWLLQHCIWERPEQRKEIFDWYQQRLEIVPAREEIFTQSVNGLTKKYAEDKQRKVQTVNDKGQFLFYDGDGSPTTRSSRQSAVPSRFLTPDEGVSDRSMRGMGLTESEVRDVLRSQKKLGSDIFFAYIKNPDNHLVKTYPNQPVQEPARYTHQDIERQISAVTAVVDELAAYQASLDAQISILDEHLWISPSLPAHASLKRRQDIVNKLAECLNELHKGFLSLPRRNT